VQSNEGDEAAVEKMILEKDLAKQRTLFKEVTSGWDEVDRMDLKKMVDDARTFLDRKDAMRASAHGTAKEQKELAAQREAEQKETTRKEFTKAAADAAKSVRDRMPFTPLADGETEDERYSALEQRVAATDFDAANPRAKALAVASTFALTHAIKTIGKRDEEITGLKDALAKALKGVPSVDTKADTPADEGEQDYFAAMDIPEPKNMFGTQ